MIGSWHGLGAGGLTRSPFFHQCCPHRTIHSSLVIFLSLILLGATARAQIQTVWQIGVDEDPFQSGYNATDEFSQENFTNDRPPGKVTRLPGDPLYNAANNPTADDDFYCAGTYP